MAADMFTIDPVLAGTVIDFTFEGLVQGLVMLVAALLGAALLLVAIARVLFKIVTRQEQDPAALAVICIGVLVIGGIMIAPWVDGREERALLAELDEIIERSSVDESVFDAASAFYFDRSPAVCARATLDLEVDGWQTTPVPSSTGRSATMSELVALDAARFESDGWSVRRFAGGGPDAWQREPAGWRFTATKDDQIVSFEPARDRYKYVLGYSACTGDLVGDELAEGVAEVDGFNTIPQTLAHAEEQAVALRKLLPATAEVRIESTLAAGYGVDAVCAAARVESLHSRSGSATAELDHLGNELALDGWNIDIHVTPRPNGGTRSRVVAEREGRVIVAGQDGIRDPLVVIGYPAGCADKDFVAESFQSTS